MEWRSGIEKDIDEVVQIANVFSNVSKGQVVNSNDLEKVFGKVDMSKAIEEVSALQSRIEVWLTESV